MDPKYEPKFRDLERRLLEGSVCLRQGLKQFEDLRCGSPRGHVLLARDEIAVDHYVRRPRGRRLELGTRQTQAVFEKPGRVAGEGRLRLFLVGEGGELSPP